MMYVFPIKQVTVAGIGGGGFISLKYLLDWGYAPFQVIFGRFLTASVCMCLVYCKRLKRITKEEWSACGGNLLAAQVSGINTTKIRISTFAIAGLLAGLSGFLMTSRVTIAQPTAAESYEMDAITACVEGGVSMTGGVGKPWGVVIGCLLITVIANGLDIMGVSSHWQKIVKGVIIVVAVLIDVKGKTKKN